MLAGGCPAATHFLLLRQKKVSKEKATLLSASLRFATGNLRCSVQPGSKTTRFAQTSFCPDPSGPPLLGADRRGGEGIPIPNIKRNKDSPWRVLVGICLWYLVPAPDWPFCMRRGAEIQADQGSRCLSEASLARPRLNRAPQVAPERSAGDADSRVAFSLVTFFWRSKRKLLAAGQPPANNPQKKAQRPISSGRRSNQCTAASRRPARCL
ncbi:hypothetical protein SAMN05216350_1051 [Polaromonas sp. YR568]|nr:hypothetical protein SAMN05216350_1051 [Polaromonas sp. YR568]